MKNQPKINQKSIQHPPKIDLGESCGFLGPLGLYWRPSGAPQARPGDVLAPSRAALEPLGGVLVANMDPTWLPKRSQIRLKIEAKNEPNFDAS